MAVRGSESSGGFANYQAFAIFEVGICSNLAASPPDQAVFGHILATCLSLSDADLWHPEHVATMGNLLSDADFAAAASLLHVTAEGELRC